MTDFSTDGFDSLYPKYKGGRPKTSARPQARRPSRLMSRHLTTKKDTRAGDWAAAGNLVNWASAA
ncbi:hypothetical protein ACFYPB_10465 [Streptomyces olivaceoviridis]|uniref:hypothetical protein n=1 Tax=Streptomyces olivaceoviridis TaxID=1921 RepID=UPI0036A09BDF